MRVTASAMVGMTLLWCACGADDTGEVVNAEKEAPAILGDATAGCSKMQLPNPSDYAVQIQLGTTLEPGEEGEFCAIQQVGDSDIWLNWSDVLLSTGSHHGLLWQASYEGELPETDNQGDPIQLGKLRPCEGGANSRFDVRGVMAGSQGSTNSTAKGVLPADVALHIPARSYVVMNFHMLNATDKPIDPCMKVGVHSIDKKHVAQEAGVLFFFNGNIAVPAHGSASARLACPITQPISLKSNVSHMHSRGVGYEAKLLSGDPYAADTKTLEMLYETTQWDAPSDKLWDEPKQLQKGQYIDYSCHYENTEDHDVAQGLDTTDEMCMFMGVYWPRNDALSFCSDPKTGRDAGYQIGDGRMSGSEFTSCITSSDFEAGATEGCGRAECNDYGARYHFQSCFTQACPAIGKYTLDYVNCLGAHSPDCQETCAGKPASCTFSCLHEQHCKPQVQALNDTACD